VSSALTHKYKALDAFRGVFAILIVLVHFSAYGYFYDLPFVRNAGRGVDFFFVLSGFVITSAYLDKIRSAPNFTEFVVKRVGRLWPLHLAMLAALVVLELVKFAAFKFAHISMGQLPFTGSNGLVPLAGGILLLNGLGFFHQFTWNVPSWSISAEFATYLLFFFLACRGRLYALAAAVIAAIAGVALIWFGLPPHKLRVIEGYGLISCIFDFMIGSLTFLAFRQGWLLKADTKLEAICLALLVIVFFVSVPLMSVIAPLVFVLVIQTFAQQSGWFSRIATTAFPQYLGKTSYSIYLVHFVVIQLVMAAVRVADKKLHLQAFQFAGAPNSDVFLIGNRLIMDVFALLLLTFVIWIAGWTYRYIETPGQKLAALLTSQTTAKLDISKRRIRRAT